LIFLSARMWYEVEYRKTRFAIIVIIVESCCLTRTEVAQNFHYKLLFS
jgi:hypothetical protein